MFIEQPPFGIHAKPFKPSNRSLIDKASEVTSSISHVHRAPTHLVFPRILSNRFVMRLAGFVQCGLQFIFRSRRDSLCEWSKFLALGTSVDNGMRLNLAAVKRFSPVAASSRECC